MVDVSLLKFNPIQCYYILLNYFQIYILLYTMYVSYFAMVRDLKNKAIMLNEYDVNYMHVFFYQFIKRQNTEHFLNVCCLVEYDIEN